MVLCLRTLILEIKFGGESQRQTIKGWFYATVILQHSAHYGVFVRNPTRASGDKFINPIDNIEAHVSFTRLSVQHMKAVNRTIIS